MSKGQAGLRTLTAHLLLLLRLALDALEPAFATELLHIHSSLVDEIFTLDGEDLQSILSPLFGRIEDIRGPCFSNTLAALIDADIPGFDFLLIARLGRTEVNSRFSFSSLLAAIVLTASHLPQWVPACVRMRVVVASVRTREDVELATAFKEFVGPHWTNKDPNMTRAVLVWPLGNLRDVGLIFGRPTYNRRDGA